MIELEAFLPLVLPYAPACTDPLAEHHVRVAATTLCKRTRAWRETDCFMSSGEPIEAVCIPPYANLHEIEDVWFNGKPLSRKSYGDAQGNACVTESGSPRAVTQIAPDTLRLTPPGRGEMKLSLFLKPDPQADMLPRFLFDHFGQEIAAGALAEILLLPNQTWTNPQLAVIMNARFEAALDRNFAFNIRGQQRAPARTKPSYF